MNKVEAAQVLRIQVELLLEYVERSHGFDEDNYRECPVCWRIYTARRALRKTEDVEVSRI